MIRTAHIISEESAEDEVGMNNTVELYFEEDIESKYISGVDSYGNSYSSAKISRELFDIIFNKLFKF